MDAVLAIVTIAIVVVAVTALAERLRFSAPLLLMLVGIAASFVPFIHEPTLTPEVVLLGFLPPLLYATAIHSSLLDMRANAMAIGYLSVSLVLVTALGVGLITWLILPVPFALAFAFGAVVAPPDAVAATAIARRIGMPRRLVTILEGESLLNDATAITCVRVGLVAIASKVTVAEIGIGFAVAALGGLLVGVTVAAITTAIRSRISRPVFDNAISLIVPWAAYLPAEEIHVGEFHGSGVIATVVAGLLIGHKSPIVQSGLSRLSERVNWSTIQFLLENAVFLLVGLQARQIVRRVGDSPLPIGQVLWFCAAALLGVMAIRMIWVCLGRSPLLPKSAGGQRGPWSYSIVVGWAGLRGVVTLATALLIPAEMAGRDVLVFGAMVVVVGTLLIQGLTLPLLVRAFGMKGPDPRSDALQAATVLQSASNVAVAELDRIVGPDDDPAVVERVRSQTATRPNVLWERLGSSGVTPTEAYRKLRLAAIATERAEVLRIRSTGTVDHEVLEQVLGSLDVEESMLTLASARVDNIDEVIPVGVRAVGDGPCDHLLWLDEVPIEVPPRSEVCLDCVAEGTRTVHLRMCLTCGNVGCCDSSEGKHATRHFHQTQHPVMRSFEPGETWRWCYLDDRLG